jgi:hypothetical protein
VNEGGGISMRLGCRSGLGLCDGMILGTLEQTNPLVVIEMTPTTSAHVLDSKAIVSHIDVPCFTHS